MGEDRLTRIEETVAEIKVRLFAHLELEDQYNAEINELLKKHEKAIYGNGEPGLKMQLDRLQEIEKNRKWHFGILYAAAAAGAVKLILSWVRGQ